MDQQDIIDVARGLADALSAADLDTTLAQITAAAVEVLPDVQYASITIRDAEDRLETAAPTDPMLIKLDEAQYRRLAGGLRAMLPGGRALRIAGAHYADNDAFYEASGRYHLFETCNTWTGRLLRRAGAPVPAWTPFDFNVTWRLQPHAAR